MFFKKEKKVSRWLKKVDTIVTWLVLGGILASVYWIKKYEDSKKSDSLESLTDNSEKKESKSFFFKWKKDWDNQINEKKINKDEVNNKEIKDKKIKKDWVIKIVLKIILKKILWKK